MLDHFGRFITYLRLSVTERCNLHCSYCRKEEGGCPKVKELSADEFIRIARACAGLGINKVRVTGGEPTLRRDLIQIVQGLSAIQGIEEVTMTTNGLFLASQAKGLKKVGLSRVNISLDSLDADKFLAMTGGDLQVVLDGIDAAMQAGLHPVKLNAVLIRGKNDDEVDDFIALTRDKPLDVRLIELMPLGGAWEDDSLRVDNSQLIAERPYLIPIPSRYEGQPSRDFRVEGHLGRVGFISPISHRFCADCNRIRVMSDGALRPCLGSNLEISLKDALAGSDEELREIIRAAIYVKPVGHHFEKEFKSERNMSRIGG
jgi:cyclic pyranopterin phosphate synthase